VSHTEITLKTDLEKPSTLQGLPSSYFLEKNNAVITSIIC
jgi:hypothetical protein